MVHCTWLNIEGGDYMAKKKRKITIELYTDSYVSVSALKKDLAEHIANCWNPFDVESMTVRDNTSTGKWIGLNRDRRGYCDCPFLKDLEKAMDMIERLSAVLEVKTTVSDEDLQFIRGEISVEKWLMAGEQNNVT